MDRDFLHNQLIKLGDMMGDGLHHESDGKWIEKEYKKVYRALYPENFTEQRKLINEKRNNKIAEKLLTVKCPNCKSDLKQTRSGSKKVICIACNSKFVFRVRTKKDN
jgi:hypothetical protein